MMSRKWITAAALMAELENDVGYQSRIAAKRRKNEEYIARRTLAETALIRDLALVGVYVHTAEQLVVERRSYDAGLPILAAHVLRAYDDDIRHWIARSLATANALPYWLTLVAEYRKLDEASWPMTKQGLAVVLAEIADHNKRAVLDDVIELVKDRSLGSSRAMLLAPLKHSKSAKAKSFLASLADDPDLDAYIAQYKQLPGMRFAKAKSPRLDA